MRFVRFHHAWRLGMAAVLVTTLAACGESPMAASEEALAKSEPPRTLMAPSLVAHPGRTLAANCFQCHGTDGFAGELKIAGQGAAEIIATLDQMRAQSPRANIMNVHAAAYTTQEIALIADYFDHQGG